jgi:hypothetical protein
LQRGMICFGQVHWKSIRKQEVISRKRLTVFLFTESK